MKDFLYVFIMISLVMLSLFGLYYLGYTLGYWGWAILEIVVATAIILFAIRYFRSHRPPRSR